MLVLLPACGGPTGGTTPAPATPQATATPTPTAAATVAPAPTTSSTGPSNSDLLAQGKLIFEKTAGGLGCAYCHGLDGSGKGAAGMAAANIRGANWAQVRNALMGGVAMMSNVKLTDEEITSVVAYVQWLATQP